VVTNSALTLASSLLLIREDNVQLFDMPLIEGGRRMWDGVKTDDNGWRKGKWGLISQIRKDGSD
jgi:hypothetical protein